MRFGWLLLCSAALLAACGDATTTAEVVEHWWAPTPIVKPDGSKEYTPFLLPPARHAHPDVEGTERAWSSVINLTAERRIYWKAWEFDLAEVPPNRSELTEALVDGVKRYVDQLRVLGGTGGRARSLPVMLIHADAGALWDDVDFLCRTLAAQPLGFRRLCLAVDAPAVGDFHVKAVWEARDLTGDDEYGTGVFLKVAARGNVSIHEVGSAGLMATIPGPPALGDPAYLRRANAAWRSFRSAVERHGKRTEVASMARAEGVSLAHVATAIDILFLEGAKEVIVPLGVGRLVFEAPPRVETAPR